MGIIYARKGDKENALKMITELEAMHKPYDYGVIEYYQGRIYAHLGDFVQATRFLERSLQNGKKLEYWHSFSHDPDLIVLKDYPAYQELMKQLN
jgi:tetratricopeptide (TPR) repeat protein